MTGSRPRKNSLASSESILDQADREKQRNKQRQRELERQYVRFTNLYEEEKIK